MSCRPRGAYQGQDGTRPASRDGGQAPLGLKLANGQVLEDPVFHVGQSVVVLVEDPRRLIDVKPVL